MGEHYFSIYDFIQHTLLAVSFAALFQFGIDLLRPSIQSVALDHQVDPNDRVDRLGDRTIHSGLYLYAKCAGLAWFCQFLNALHAVPPRCHTFGMWV